MEPSLSVLEAGAGVTVQDMGRPGWIARGLSRAGAVDQLALAEGAALLGQPVQAALEMAGFGGVFQPSVSVRIALTGAEMAATLDGAALRWHASHRIEAGQALRIGGARSGVYGYLTLGGGLATTQVLGAQGAHVNARIGRPLQAGDELSLGTDDGKQVGMALPTSARIGPSALRVLPSLQTSLYAADDLRRFEASRFTRDSRGNRMGVRLVPEGTGFALAEGGRIVSEIITPGDIQIPGDGAPYILLAECQTTGGYPRIGTVIPADLPRVAQSAPGSLVTFRFVTRDVALQAERQRRQHFAELPRKVVPLVRDPWQMTDLLRYQLIDGATTGTEP